MSQKQPRPRKAADIRHCLPKNRRQTATWRGLVLFTAAGLCYGAAFVGTATMTWLPGQLLGCGLLALCLSWLAVLGHDAGHGSLTAHPGLNAVLGRLAFLPSLVPYTGWLLSHNQLHHAFTNVKGLDPWWPPLSKEEFDRLPGWRRLLERVYRTLPGLVLYYLVEVWCRTMLFPRPAVRARIRRPLVALLDRVAVVALVAAQVSGLWVWRLFLAETLGLELGHFGLALAACVVLPFLWSVTVVSPMGFFHHTHPRLRWYANPCDRFACSGHTLGTVHLVVPWPVGWLLGNSLEHGAHHADPAVPFHALPECQRHLDQAFPEVPVYEVTLRGLLAVLRACKLYDYQQHRWLNFEGQPTC